MNNYKKIIYLFIFISAIIQSCKKADDDITVEPIKCTVSTPFGKCDNQNDMCYKGKCIPKGSKCGEILAPCEDKTDICIPDTENGGYKCTEGRCNFNNLNGTCSNENMICTKRGICEYKCDEEHPKGACQDKYSCLQGNCIKDDTRCSNIVTNGVCEDGKTCALNTNSNNYECLPSCSEQYPDGACESEKKCHYNKCYFDYELCSPQNLYGVCEPGKICNEGVCERLCSTVVTNGICEYEDQVCFEGHCNYRCSHVRPNGICEEIGTKCVNGECKFKCSETIKDGYCDDENKTCVDGYCKPICGPEELTGACEDQYQICVNGECKFQCSNNYPFGVCPDEGYGCLNGTCIEQCSQQFPNGSCEQYFYCNNGTCEEVPCGIENPNGPCDTEGQRCVQGICLNECSQQQPNGWCSNENYVCYNNVCTDPTSQPCSTVFPDGFCTAWDKECINGQCTDKPCSSQYPHGRCDNGGMCVDGECSFTCLDNRPILQEGQSYSIENGGVFGSCCVVNEDCKDGFNSYGKFPTNICIYDQVHDGPYCLSLQLTKGRNNAYLCNYIGGCTGCVEDSDCEDPYPTLGEKERYFCEMVTYYDFEVQTGTKLDINISYCQRVFTNCQRLNKQQGEPCDENCNDSECATGLHCIKGFCTGQCKDDSFCTGGTTCTPLAYHLPDTDKDLFLDICIVQCENDNECNILGENYKCSTFTYKHQVLPEEIPTPKISYCRPQDNNATADLRDKCSIDDNCKGRICGEQNLCTTTCKLDSDCGTNAYCSYDNLMSGEITHVNRAGDPIDLNYLGICKYLDSNQGTPTQCSGKSDCPNTPVNGKEYQCLPKFTLLKDLPEGKSGDSVAGICGILTPTSNKAYSSEGEFCNNGSQICDTDLCVCGNGLCKDNRIGKCRNYCETSADCSGDYYCKRILVRDEVRYARAVYSGVCVPRHENFAITSCNTDGNNSDSLCQNGKTCISNPVNTKPEGDNPNKFGVEYICVEEKAGKVPLNQNCTRDSDCASQLCNMNTNKCSHACTKDSQCNDVGTMQCKMEDILVDDLNPAYIVYGGVCE